MAIASSLLIEPDNHAGPLLLDHSLGEFHLLATITVDAIEEMRGNAMRMETAQDVVVLSHITHNNGDAFLLAVVVQNFQESTEPGVERGFSKPDNHDVLYSCLALPRTEGSLPSPSACL